MGGRGCLGGDILFDRQHLVPVCTLFFHPKIGSFIFLDGCILQIESRNNKLEMQSVSNKALIEELDKLLECLRIPSEV